VTGINDNLTYRYDANGNMTAVYDTEKNYNRVLYWDDDNRLTKTVDAQAGVSTVTQYAYDAKGMRIIKDGPYGKSIYVDTGYVLSQEYVESNHIFVGNTRVASIVKHKDEEKPATYYYATDHLGSSSVLTNNIGAYHERIEYLPYGEVWVEDAANTDSYSTPYKFTGKELDKETGLYYFGARYYDARLSRWVSTDPAFEKYLPDRSKSSLKEEKLPAGGIYETINMDIYNYVGNNPIVHIDPDGNFRFGKRPLSNSKTLQIALTAIMLMFAPPDVNLKTLDTLNIEAVHEHGFYDNSNNNIGYGDDGYMTEENKSDYKLENKIYDDNLMKQAEENVMNSGQFDERGEEYNIINNNCQGFADALRKEYDKLYNNLDDKGKKEVDARVEVLRQKIQKEENNK